MTEIYVFLSTSFLWLALWALREFERRRRFEVISDQNDLLRGEAETWRGIAEAKERQLALAQDALRRAKAGKIFELGGKASLLAAAEPSPTAIIRTTTQLTANSAGPQ